MSRFMGGRVSVEGALDARTRPVQAIAEAPYWNDDEAEAGDDDEPDSPERVGQTTLDDWARWSA